MSVTAIEVRFVDHNNLVCEYIRFKIAVDKVSSMKAIIMHYMECHVYIWFDKKLCYPSRIAFGL